VKKHLHFLSLLAASIFVLTITGCVKKGIKEAITLDDAAGKWNIHAIRYKFYYGTPEGKDSTVPWKPIPENYVSFDGVSRLEYCFNSPSSTSGDYKFIGHDSIDIKVGNETNRWKIQLLTNTNFNIERTYIDNTKFPGATVVNYQGFIR
jgi:hypothetical protein